jgi:DNA-binding NtrC family response regulator
MSEAVKRVTAVVERVKLEEALKNARGNKERAAEALQVSYKALLQKQREHGLSD